jgi:hypothetical protein
VDVGLLEYHQNYWGFHLAVAPSSGDSRTNRSPQLSQWLIGFVFVAGKKSRPERVRK